MGNPYLKCVNISSHHLSFVMFILNVINSFAHCFAQLRNGPSLRTSTGSMWKRRLNTQSQLRTGTILWTHGLLPSIALIQSLPPSSCAILILRKKRVSVKFVSIDSLVCIWFFFFLFFFLQMFSSCLNDDQV